MARITKVMAMNMATNIATSSFNKKIDRLIVKLLPKIKAYIEDTYFIFADQPKVLQPFLKTSCSMILTSESRASYTYSGENNVFIHFTKNTFYPIPRICHNNTNLRDMIDTPELKQIKKEHAVIKRNILEKNQFQNTLERQIFAFRTTKKLEEAYPQFKKYLPQRVVTEKTLPAPIISDDILKVIK